MQDEIIAELWAAKDDIAKSFDYDIDALYEYFKVAEKPAVLVNSEDVHE